MRALGGSPGAYYLWGGARLGRVLSSAGQLPATASPGKPPSIYQATPVWTQEAKPSSSRRRSWEGETSLASGGLSGSFCLTGHPREQRGLSSSWLVALTYQRPPGWAVTNSLGQY